MRKPISRQRLSGALDQILLGAATMNAAEKIVRHELQKLNGDAAAEVPPDIEAQVRQHLARQPKDRWDAAVQRIATRR